MLHRIVMQPDELVQRRQRRRYLRAADHLAIPQRQKGAGAPRVGGVREALLEACRVHVGLPSGRAPGAWYFTEHRFKALASEFHLVLGPGGVLVCDEILPAHVVPAMHTYL